MSLTSGARLGTTMMNVLIERLATAAAPDQSSAVHDQVVFVFNFADYPRRLTATKR